jgi:ribosome-binding protein aMBF1 (putative translation factor)
VPENSDRKRRRAHLTDPASEFSDDSSATVHSTADLGRALQLSRKRQGLSQEELALLTDLRRSYLSEMERGVTTERFDRLFTLLDALGLELIVRRRNVRRARESS